MSLKYCRKEKRESLQKLYEALAREDYAATAKMFREGNIYNKEKEIYPDQELDYENFNGRTKTLVHDSETNLWFYSLTDLCTYMKKPITQLKKENKYNYYRVKKIYQYNGEIGSKQEIMDKFHLSFPKFDYLVGEKFIRSYGYCIFTEEKEFLLLP